jgi:hypothetical protein
MDATGEPQEGLISALTVFATVNRKKQPKMKRPGAIPAFFLFIKKSWVFFPGSQK